MTIEANATTTRGDVIVERDELVRVLMSLYRAADFRSYGNLLVTRSRLNDEIERYKWCPLIHMYLKLKRRRLVSSIDKIESRIYATQTKYHDIFRALPLEAYVHKSCLWTLIDDIVMGRAKNLDEAKALWGERQKTDQSWYCIER